MTADLPKTPLAHKPGGYLGLGNYSSLGTFWRYLRGAAGAGRTVSPVRGDSPDTCRRRISGYTVPGAGFLLDTVPLDRELTEGFETHPALLAYLSGDPGPLREELNAHYALHTDFVLALTARRELIVRPEFEFRPSDGAASLPAGLTLRGRRMSKDEIGVLLSRACGV